ncbi:MAG TPA: ribonuclease HII [Candidatus Acidoferrales bacterium]|nr:ribonuclease HII [Candidatus Acidoferrales bacterium]
MGRLCCTRYEREARQHGWLRIAGLDEAGRGSLFGPVVAAAVILNPRRRIVGLDDSKKLTPDRRHELAPRIREHALAWAVAEIEASRIDAWNIYQASRQAMMAAVSLLFPLPDYLLLDAIEIDLPIEQKALIHGDARSVSIAAASILAKVERDQQMQEFDQLYPQYGLARNKGYGTPDHLEALQRHGPSPLHRFSYSPVREAGCWAVGAKQDILPLTPGTEAVAGRSDVTIIFEP